MDIPLCRLYSLTTFYRSFSLKPRGKYELSVCTGTVCHVRGSNQLLAHLQRRLEMEAGETTPDGLVTLVSVNCLGACALGPVLTLDGRYHGHMTAEKVDQLLASLRQTETKDKK